MKICVSNTTTHATGKDSGVCLLRRHSDFIRTSPKTGNEWRILIRIQ